MTGTLTATPATARDLPVRRVKPLDDRPIRRDFVHDDLLMSNALAVLSAMFPAGEEFFIRSVRRYRDRIDDPELNRQVNLFAGQESTHRRAHQQLNERLAELGYRTRVIDLSVEIGFNQVSGRVLPPAIQLAITAALEHYTATFAEVLLDDPDAQSMIDDDQILRLLLWHAVEESEHKAVAYDVYESMVGNAFIRRAVMDAMTVAFLGGLAIGTAYSAIASSSFREIPSFVRSVFKLRGSPFISLRVLRRLREYNRTTFHPDVFDTSALIDSWRNRLFAGDG